MGRLAKKNRSGKGALLKGMSRRLPSEILQDSLFEKRLREIMRGYAGIYALYHGKKLYYTGLTKDLFGRIRHHNQDRHAGRWDHFIIFRIHKVRYLKDIETLILNLLPTHGNKSRGKVPRDADLNRVLRSLAKEYRKRLAGYERSFR